MLKTATIIAFAATADASRARKFYRDVLGLRLTEDSPFALVFDAHGVMLRVQKVPAVAPATYTTLGWQVTNVRRTISALVRKGVRCERYDGLEQDDLGIWTSPGGGRIAWFRDPDGNILSLTQWP